MIVGIISPMIEKTEMMTATGLYARSNRQEFSRASEFGHLSISDSK